MSLRSVVPILALTLEVLTTGAWSPAEPGESALRVVRVAGRAEVQAAGAAAWTTAALRGDLGLGASARTLLGRLVLKTASGQELRLAPLSQVSLLEGGAAEMPTPVGIAAGSVWVAVRPGSSAREQLEVRTGRGTVVVRDGGVGIALGQDGSMLVRVYHGAATCAGPGIERQWTRDVGEGQELLVPGAGLPGETRKFARDKVDANWLKWNEDQDLAGGYGARTPEQ